MTVAVLRDLAGVGTRHGNGRSSVGVHYDEDEEQSLRDVHSAECLAWREKQGTPLRPSFLRRWESSVLRLDSGSRPAALPGMTGSSFRHSSESWNPGSGIRVWHFVSEQQRQAIFACTL